MNGNEKADGLPRRQFVRLSGAAGTAVLLAGTGAGKDPAAATRSPACGPRPGGAASCPTPSDICGRPTDKVFLWEKVQACEQKMSTCTSLHTTDDYVILRGDPATDHNYLLVPTCRITGIECPFIWGSTAYKGYWYDAWEQAQPGKVSAVEKYTIGLGINSKSTRTEDQLHIHMAGILSRVQGQLNTLEKNHQITSDRKKWSAQVVPVVGRDPKTEKAETRNYRAVIFSTAELKENLFRALGDYVPDAKKDMANQMLVVTPRSNGGFYVLNSDPGLKGGGIGIGGTGTADFLLVYK